MKSVVPHGGYAVLALSIVLVSSRSAVSGGQATSLVRLQTATPGVAQTGHLNISGTAIAGQFQGGGSGVTGVNAAQLGGLPLSALGVKAFPNTWTGVNTFSNASNSFTGNGAGLNGVDADRLGGILPTSYAVKSATNTWAGINNFANSNNSFAGDGSLLTSLNASNLASGTVPDALLDVGGDLKGTLSAATVSRIQGLTVSASTPTAGQVLGFSGTQWVPQSDGLALPFSETVNTTLPALKVVNSGGAGTHIISTNLTGNALCVALGNFLLEVPKAAFVATTAVDSGFGVYSNANNEFSTATAGRFFSQEDAIIVDLGTKTEAIRTNGFLWRDYNSTAPSVAVPVAYGVVSSAGLVLSGTGNFTVVRAAAGQFDITIDGETYSNNTFTVTVTPVSNSPRLTAVADPGNAFRVNIWNIGGTLTDTQFQFSVYTTNPANPG